MATIRARSNGTFELRVIHKALAKPFYSTHDTRLDAEDYARRLVDALARGQVPPELKPAIVESCRKLSNVLDDYLRQAPIASSDRPMVQWLRETVQIDAQGLTVRWVDDWVRSMKREERLAPSTIRKRVESLARAVDWWQRQTFTNDVVPSNPLRTLPRGYSTYGKGDVAPGQEPRVDKARDRRLAPGEQEAIERVIQGLKRPDGVAFLLLFRLIVSTGLRLREAYSLRGADVRVALRTIHVARSKTGRARDVPMSRQVQDWMAAAPAEPEALVFPFWNGDDATLEKVTSRLSTRFSDVFKRAGCFDMTEHDLRHEAVCRWMLMRDAKGQFLFRPEEVRRITGHISVQQFERYLSLRGSDLAERLP